MPPTDAFGLKMAEAVGFLRRAFVVPVLALFAVSAWGEGLFIPLDAGAAAGTSGGQRLLDGREGDGWPVRVHQRRLFRTIHGVAAQGSGRLMLNVAQDLEFEVVVERTSPTLSGYSLSGRVAGVAGSAVTFAAGAEVLAGVVWTPRAVYELVPKKDGVHVFRQVDLAVWPQLAEPIRAEGGWDAFAAIDQASADGDVEGGPVVDILVLWTPRARERVGGEAQMRTHVDLAVASANDAYERSGAEVRLNLVGAEEVDYVEDELIPGEVAGRASGTDINRLMHPSDGFMDEAHARRDALGADLVSLFTAGGGAGIADMAGPFSVAGWYRDFDNYTVIRICIHELGHNMGLSHDRFQEMSIGAEGLLPFSYGYVKPALEPGAHRDDCWMTIMAYPTRCTHAGLFDTRVPYFSNPDIRLSAYPELAPDDDGAPLGVPKSSDEAGADGPADAVSALNLRAPLVANFNHGLGDDGDTAETATPVVANSTNTAVMAGTADVDYFRIELPEAGTLRVETTGFVDLRGTLTTENGELIAEDDDNGKDGNFQIEAELEAGVYLVKVEGRYTRPFDDYALVVTFNPASAADDHGDSAAHATDVAAPSATVGELENTSDTDVFRFEVAERSAVRVGSSGETDVVATLLSEDGSIRVTDDDGGEGTNFSIAIKLDPGVYFVSVRGFGGITTGAYSLDISFSPLSIEADDHADFPAGATNIAVGASAGGELEVLRDRDYFRIEVPAGTGPGQLWVESKGETDVKGALLRQDGELMVEDSAAGEGTSFVVGAQVAPGAYILRVEGESDSDAGRYIVEGSFVANSRVIPLFLSAAHPNRWSFARIVNRDNRPGTVTIHAIDDSGRRRDPVLLSLAAQQTAHFNSAELENGSVAKGLSGGVGAGEGDWRLELETMLDIEALAYMRTEGYLAGMNDIVTTESIPWEEVAPTFNAASSRQVSKLRLINTGPSPVLSAFVRGHDDRGESHQQVFMRLQRGASRTFTAQEMEVGHDDFWDGSFWQGSLGDGAGTWRLQAHTRFPVRAMSLIESPAGHLANLTAGAAHTGTDVSLPLFISASSEDVQGFARIINRSSQPGRVTIHAIDDEGTRRGPVTLRLAAGEAKHFDADDLEVGNRNGVSGRIGVGSGHWRLEFAADTDIEALAYARTPDGFLTGMNTLAPAAADGRREVVFFNPASNNQRVSRLRLVNPTTRQRRIAISGLDDYGNAPPEGNVTLTLPAGAATSITAQQLEEGASHFNGRFGDGRGKWRLFIEANRNVQAMSLVESPTGHTNLSSGTAVR